MSDEVTAPSFDEAAQSFRTFLVAQGWPGHIVWIRDGDVIRRAGDPVTICRSEQADGEKGAQRKYEIGRRRGLGVLLEAICTLGDATCAIVAYPVDEREAELLMYPSDGGLKLSVAVPRIEGVARWSSC
jgi:hypothetical protein